MKRDCSGLYLHFLLDMLSSQPERFRTWGRWHWVETCLPPPSSSFSFVSHDILLKDDVLLGKKEVSLSLMVKKESISVKQKASNKELEEFS